MSIQTSQRSGPVVAALLFMLAFVLCASSLAVLSMIPKASDAVVPAMVTGLAFLVLLAFRLPFRP